MNINRRYKRVVSIFLAVVILFTTMIIDCKRVSAFEPITFTLSAVVGLASLMVAIEDSETYQDIYQGNPYWVKARDGINEALEMVGFSHKYATLFNPFVDKFQELKQFYAQKKNKNVNEVTDQEVEKYVKDATLNIDIHDNDIKFGSDYANLMRWYAEQIMEENRMYYGYTLDLQYYDFRLGTGANRKLYDEDIVSFIKEYQEDYYILWAAQQYNPVYVYYLIPKERYSWVLSSIPNNDLYRVVYFDNITFTYNSSYDTHYFLNKEDVGSVPIGNPQLWSFIMKEHKAYRSTDYSPYVFSNIDMVSYGKQYMIPIYGTYQLLQDMGRGKSPYYIGNTWNEFNNSTGDYVVDSHNVNTVTYNDIDNYIDNYPGYPNIAPTIEEIEEYIKNKRDTDINIIVNPTVNPSNPSGGTGGGSSATATATNGDVNVTVNNNHYFNFGGSVSGNSVSDNDIGSGGSVWDFSWISTIGQTLGNLISNLGSAISNLIRGIAEVLEGLVETIPTVFGDFIGMLLGWLPPELRALVTLGFVAMIMFGLVKVIRG